MNPLGLLGFGRHDPCARWIEGSFWFAARTPDGPGTIRLYASSPPGTVQQASRPPEIRQQASRAHEIGQQASRAHEIGQQASHPPGIEQRTEALGPGAAWLLARAPGLRGEWDDLTGFDPQHDLVKRLPELRLPRTGLVFPRVMRAICEQKVTGKEAYRAYSAIVRHFREPAPGPVTGLLLPPSAEMIAATPYYHFHELGLERRRTEVLRRAAFEATRLESCVDSAMLEKRLLSIPGIGPWTVAEVNRTVFGDADAVSVGDYHLKNIISWALAGEPRGTDERMLELLAPFAGHRGRVCLMIESAGIGAPRYGPRAPIRDFRTY